MEIETVGVFVEADPVAVRVASGRLSDVVHKTGFG